MTGQSYIGNTRSTSTIECGKGINPATGELLEPTFYSATEAELEQAITLAEDAYMVYRNKSGEEKAAFLEQIASNVEAAVPLIVARGPLETGLPEGRMQGESGRVMGQLRMFASTLRQGHWIDARIDTAQPDRAPVPKPDIRSMHRPVGPVAVFAASNFPLAFSVAGGDTASALAAGCPVIVKAHSSHPGLSEIVADCIISAVKSCGMPDGTFSLIHGSGRTLGQALVKAPQIQAVGFTGSYTAGRALMDIAAARPQPIPVFAEMSAINPVVFLPSSIGKDDQALAQSTFGALTMGVGQFCTNPGLILLPAAGSEAYISALTEQVNNGASATMLNAGICDAYRGGVSELMEQAGVEILAQVQTSDIGSAGPAAFLTTSENLRDNSSLTEEVFGPATLLVTYTDHADLMATLETLGGQLTAAIHGSAEEITEKSCLTHLLERKAGRLVINGYGTGVEVCQSMVHGGPFPATSDPRSTSVGAMAIYRFSRPVAYQDYPQTALPVELQDANPLNIPRLLNGENV